MSEVDAVISIVLRRPERSFASSQHRVHQPFGYAILDPESGRCSSAWTTMSATYEGGDSSADAYNTIAAEPHGRSKARATKSDH